MVRALGFFIFLFGLVMIVMGVTVTIGSSWISDLMPIESTDQDTIDFANDASSLGSVFEILIYVFGIYTFMMGVLACCCCGNPKQCQGKCLWVTLFQLFQLVLIAMTLVIAALPFSFYAISDNDVETFCNTSYEDMQANYPFTTESYEEMVLEGRKYVEKVDDTVNQRSELMCTSSCPCAIDSWDKWGDDFNSRDFELGGTITNWEGCATELDANPDRNGNSLTAGI